MSGPQCEVNIAKTWEGPIEQCPQAAVGIVDIADGEYWACADHGGAS